MAGCSWRAIRKYEVLSKRRVKEIDRKGNDEKGDKEGNNEGVSMDYIKQ